ncbi:MULTISPECIES: MraY family glycosyltransferase [unclassified Legionella]|uniref:MraY family glycosyltransferase n=1 Tax=unclassified Legionella TaxID=2622702 RepID=UPI001E45F662|nr:glycosyltransferase family 4 protein [Legionella sp. 31fI33]MCC5015552.1 glycosyltransferase family 4 protein [Legionella sp. 31fI33]
MAWFSFYLVILTVSCLVTWLLRRYALATSLIDIPNHRSSHQVPTPRGGGLSFVFCFLAATFFLFSLKCISLSVFATLLLSGGGIAVLGFLDDRGHIPAKWRLLGHFIATGLALYLLGGMPAISLFNWTLAPGFISNVLAVFYLVWLLNLYNFMDGIDGLAGVEAITVCLGGVLLYCLQADFMAIFLPLCLAFAVTGFLIWNFPPARIFMGDAGSGFLGLVLGLLSLQATTVNASFFWSWLILLGVFIVDATVTLVRRGLSGEKLSEAHRSHAYQHASRHYGGHLPVTVGVLVINVLWLLPWSLLVGVGYLNGCLGLLIAYSPLMVLALKFNAGKRE